MDETRILKSCEDLHVVIGGIIGINLFQEVRILRNITLDSCTRLNALKYIICNKLSEIYTNMIVPLKILLRTLNTVVSVDRSFSKPKLTKENYLRLTGARGGAVG
jgi:hypothetical protein